MTVIEPALVRNAARLFEMLRSDALPWTRSLELIAEAISRWTQLAAPVGARQVTTVLTGGECIEVGQDQDLIAIRDTKNRAGLVPGSPPR